LRAYPSALWRISLRCTNRTRYNGWRRRVGPGGANHSLSSLGSFAGICLGKILPVHVTSENILPAVPTTHDVINRSRIFGYSTLNLRGMPAKLSPRSQFRQDYGLSFRYRFSRACPSRDFPQPKSAVTTRPNYPLPRQDLRLQACAKPKGCTYEIGFGRARLYLTLRG
jgi:hypothetical protein